MKCFKNNKLPLTGEAAKYEKQVYTLKLTREQLLIINETMITRLLM